MRSKVNFVLETWDHTQVHQEWHSDSDRKQRQTSGFLRCRLSLDAERTWVSLLFDLIIASFELSMVADIRSFTLINCMSSSEDKIWMSTPAKKNPKKQQKTKQQNQKKKEIKFELY